MRRFASLAAVLAILLIGLLVSARGAIGAAAQDTTPATMVAHPVVGGWRNTIDLGNGIVFPSLSLFHADGTYVEVLPDGGILLGVWQPTGDRTADLTLYSHYLIDDKPVIGEGRSAVEVDETGTTMTGTGTFVGLFEDGSIDIAVETSGPATRLEVLPVLPPGANGAPVAASSGGSS